MQYSFSAYSIPLLIAALVAGFLAWYSWTQRKTDGALSFSWMMFLIFYWGVTYTVQVSAVTLEAITFWQDVTFIAVVLTPVTWFLFALEYTGRKSLIARYRLNIWLFVIPVISILLIFTNDLHHLWWVSREMVHIGGIFLASTINGFWFWWVHAVYSYIALILGAALLTQALLHWPVQYRGQMVWILIAIGSPFVANIITIFNFLPTPIDLTPFAFTITGLGMGFALFRHRLLDLVPIAREAVIESMRDGMLVMDAGNRIVDSNPAASAILGFEKGFEPIGKDVSDVLSRWPGLIKQFDTDEEIKQEVLFGDDENALWYEFTLSPLRDDRKVLTGRVLIIRDITQVKETQAVLQDARDKAIEASLAKSHLLAKVSHELRTPLGGVLGYAELLETNTFGDLNEKQKRAVNEIVNSANYLNGMVSELLDQAQIESNSIILQKNRFNIKEFLEHASAGIAVMAKNKGLAFETSIELSAPAEVYGDERRLRQVLINLAGNAIKFTQQGKVQIRIAGNDGGWFMQIVDTGIGIPKESQPYIFDPFRQADNAMTRDNRGIGLGLAITRQLVELMGGTISLESVVGKGSTFTVTFKTEKESL